MKHTIFFIIAIVLLLAGSPAWSDSTKEEIAKLQSQIAEVQKDLAEIKEMLKEGARAPAAPAQPAFKQQVVSLDSSPVMGNASAPVTMIEYSDYQCPFCARNYQQVLPKLKEEYIDTGKLKVVMREYPLETLHRNAMIASMAALCAGKQGKYWDMHNVMFDNQKELASDNLKSYAADLGLDTASFNNCLDTEETKNLVRRDLASGGKLGMHGTPGFFLGLTDPSDPDKVDLSVQIRGAQGYDKFKQEIDGLLKSVE